MRDARLSDLLLAWYDDHAREMPWRIGPAARGAGARPDPYRVWLSEVMLQQTTVAAVRSYFRRFVELWPDVHALAAAEGARVMGEWAGLGYYARARNLLKCARIVSRELDGRFPETRSGLLELPGIGPYTASAIAAIAFDQPETVVDGNVERVVARLHAVEEPLPGSKKRLARLAAGLTPETRSGDYAQAIMDLGATICTPRSPACGICPWMAECAARAGSVAAELPRKDTRKAKPVRRGVAYVARRSDGAWLLETRPAIGLLGGMLGWPGSGWADRVPNHTPPVEADWKEIGEVRHTFTHFHLVLTLRAAETDATPERGRFVPKEAFRPSDLPTLMRKAHDLVQSALAARQEETRSGSRPAG